MSETDKRVVEFEFENSKFESNVKKSMSTLDKLKKSLNFEDVADNLDKVSVKFSTMEIAAITAISNITNRVIDLGVILVKSLSIDNIASGWQKYGEKTMSVATMASQTIKIAGKEISNYESKLEAINTQLEKLNWFTDQTSYNFTDMVNNIGKFTAAGVDLDVAVNAMMGIANWAALSGQNAVVASRAMYQLSQSLGKGYVQLIDYKSIQNANMDTQEFRQTVLDTAVAMKKLTKEGENYITKTGSKFTKNQFTEQLSDKWFTSDVLNKSLEKYSAAVQRIYEISEETGLTAYEVINRYGSELDEFGVKAFKAAQEARTFRDSLNAIRDAVSTGWMNTAEKVFGAYTESKELWSDLADELYEVFAAGGDFRNNVLKTWSDLAGRSDLFTHGGSNQGAFWNIYDSIIAVKTAISNAWETIFPKSAFVDQAERAKDIGARFKEFTARLKEHTKQMLSAIQNDTRFTRILQGLFSVLKVGVTILKALWYALDPIIYTVKTMVGQIAEFAAEIGDSLSNTETVTNKIINIAQKLNEVLAKIVEFINPTGILAGFINILKAVARAFKNVFKNISKSFNDVTNDGETLTEFMKGLISLAEGLKKVFVSLAETLSKYLSPVLEFLVENFGNLLGSLVGFMSYILKYIGKLGQYLGELLGNIGSFEDFANTIAAGFRKVGNAIVAFFSKVTSVIKNAFNKSKSDNQTTSAVVSVAEEAGINENTVKELSWWQRFWNGLVDVFKKFEPTLNSLKSLGNSLLELLNNTIDVVTSVINVINAFLKDVINFMNDMAGGLDGLWDWIKKWWLWIAVIGTTIAIGIKMYQLIYMLVLAVKQIPMVLDSLSGLLDKLAWRQLGEMVRAVGAGILYFAIGLSIMGAAFENNTSGMWQAIGAVSIMIVIIGAIAILMAKFSSKTKNTYETMKRAEETVKRVSGTGNNLASSLRAISSMLVSFGFAMIEMALAFQIMSGIDTDAMTSGTIVLGILAGAILLLTALALIASKKDKDIRKAYGGFFSFIAMAILVRQFGKTLLSLKDISWSELWGPLLAIVTVMGALAGLLAVLKILNNKDIAYNKILKSLSGMILSLSILGLSLKPLSEIPVDGALRVLLMLGSIFIGLGSLMLFTSVITKAMKNGNATARVISSMTALLWAFIPLTLSIALLGKMNAADAWSGVAVFLALTTIINSMLATVSLLSMVPTSSTTKIDKMMYALSVMMIAMIGLTLSIGLLSAIDPGPLWIAIGAMTVIFIELGVLMAALVAIGTMQSSAKSILASMGGIIIGLLGMILGLKILADMDVASLFTAIGAMAIIILELSVMIAVISKATKDSKAGGSIGAAIGIVILLGGMITAISLLSEYSFGDMMAVAGAITLFMLGISVAMRILSGAAKDVKDALKTVLLIGGVLALLGGLVDAVKILEDVNPGVLVMVTAMLALSILSIVGALALMSKLDISAEKLLGFAAGLNLIAISCFIFAQALSALSDVGLKTLAISLIVVAGALGVIFIMSKMGQSVVPVILAVAAAMLIFSISIGLIGSAMGTLAENLGPFVESVSANLETILNIIGTTLTSAMEYIISHSDLILETITTLLSIILDTIITMAPKLVTTIITLVKEALRALKEILPEILDFVVNLISTVLKALRDNLATWVTYICETVISVIDALTAQLPELIRAFTDFLVTFIVSSMENMGRNIGPLINAAITFVLTLVRELGKAFKNRAGEMVETFIEFGKNLMAGLWNGIVYALAELLGSIPFIGDAIEEWMKDSLEIHSPSRMTYRMGDYLMQGLANGMTDNTKYIDDASSVIGSTVEEAYDRINSELDSDDTLVITPILDTSNIDNGVLDINKTLSSINGGRTSVATRLTGTTSTNSANNQNQNGSTITNNNSSSNDTYTVTFNVTSDDPEELANQLDSILQQRRLQANLAKGGV